MTQAPQIESLRSNLAALIEESQALRTDVRTAEAARRRENLINLVLSVVGIILFGIVLVVAFQTSRISDQIASCTTPDGQCYQDSSKRTSGTVQRLVQYDMFIVQCSRTSKSDAALEACVTDKIRLAERPLCRRPWS